MSPTATSFGASARNALTAWRTVAMPWVPMDPLVSTTIIVARLGRFAVVTVTGYAVPLTVPCRLPASTATGTPFWRTLSTPVRTLPVSRVADTVTSMGEGAALAAPAATAPVTTAAARTAAAPREARAGRPGARRSGRRENRSITPPG